MIPRRRRHWRQAQDQDEGKSARYPRRFHVAHRLEQLTNLFFLDWPAQYFLDHDQTFI